MTITPQVVAMLPYQGNKVLMQLRDQKKGIAFPGHWGFLSGTIEPGEIPLQCARRELWEEIGCITDEWTALSVDRVYAPDDIIAYSFCFPIKMRREEIRLREGRDIGFFALDEICSRQLFSEKTRRKHPVVEHPMIESLVRKMMSQTNPLPRSSDM